ncbi:protein kinase [Streptomyces coeruleorubidus]|uniref:serine/threonine-protein kinase n=1 Tax=Streptomyces coeruleorubidus TaxID=116188 RepID=UPI00237F4292|nr:serine/threonine-protein kinase [Streptomyces coeruleorubidus]WDV49823.1 protein kinase [Streptomyces coeruleorubidus]
MSTGEYGQADGAGRLLAGRYRVTGQLGRGGMGVVWKAVDEVLGREVAVKELRTYTDAAGPELAGLQVRMQREARAAARVRHTGVIAVHDIAEVDGRPLIVMELVDGPSLDDVLRDRGPLDAREAAGIGAKVMDALAAAHRVGVLHRDVKPGNILLDRSGRVVLTDFGIATMEDPGDGSATHLTRSGELVGSLDYLAPERAQGADPGPASDIWALGATLYAAVEGSSPFRRTSTFSTLTAIVTEPLPEPRRAGPLAPVLKQLLDKRPEGRPEADRAREMLQTVADTGGTDTPTSSLRGTAAPASPTRPETERSVPSVPPGFGPPQHLRPGAAGPHEDPATPDSGTAAAFGTTGTPGATAFGAPGQAGSGSGQPAQAGPGPQGSVPGSDGSGSGPHGSGHGSQGSGSGQHGSAHGPHGAVPDPHGAVPGSHGSGSAQHDSGPGLHGSGAGLHGAVPDSHGSGHGPQGSGSGSHGSALGSDGSGASPQASGPGLHGSAPGPQGSGPGPHGSGAGPHASAPGPLAPGPGPQGFGPAGPGGTAPGASAPTGPMNSPATPRRKTRVLLAAAAVTVVLAAAGTTVALLADSDGKGTGARTDAARADAGASAAESGRSDDGSNAPRPEGQGDEKGKAPSKKPGDEKKPEPTGRATTSAPAKSSGGTTGDTTGGTSGGTSGGGGTGGGSGDGGTTGGGGTTTEAPVCHAIGGGKYNCQVWKTAKSYTASGTEVGVLNAGTNYFYCQQNLGRRETDGQWTNVWWARTDDDSGNTNVWVSDVYIKGGDNDAPVPGLPVC